MLVAVAYGLCGVCPRDPVPLQWKPDGASRNNLIVYIL